MVAIRPRAKPELRVSSTDRRRAALALLLVVPAPSIGAATAFFLAPGALGQAVYAAGKLLLYGLPLLWHLAVEKQPLSFSPVRRGGGLQCSRAILASRIRGLLPSAPRPDRAASPS